MSSATPNEPAWNVTSFAIRTMSRPFGYSGVRIVHFQATMPMSLSPGERVDSCKDPSGPSTSSRSVKTSAGICTPPIFSLYLLQRVMSSSFIMPRNSGAYVEPAARAMVRRIANLLPDKMSGEQALPLRASAKLVGLPVTGSSFSKKQKIRKYSPLIDEATTRNESVRPAALPIPTFNTISSTFICSKRRPCFETNVFMKSSKRSLATSGVRSTFSMKFAKRLLFG
mmetsp:Transcript_21658/g.60467  ORF Transcript_21658/g.60467 Transcript_21658/m.60467 type:complete len:226 (+) Transcript_21658:1924-2601(+)